MEIYVRESEREEERERQARQISSPEAQSHRHADPPVHTRLLTPAFSLGDGASMLLQFPAAAQKSFIHTCMF